MSAGQDESVNAFGAPRPRLYLLLGLIFGVLWLPLVGLYAGGVFGGFVPVGVITIVGAQLLLRPIGRLERHLVVSLLDQPVPAPRPLRYTRYAGSGWASAVNLFRLSVAAITDGHSWRVLAWILARAVIGPLGFVVVLVLPWWTRAVADLHRELAVWALGPGRDEIAAAALARAARAEEQVRIDQELHDSIGHMLSMIVVQAGAGAHVFDRDPDFARRALGTIERRGRAALGELDRIISHIQGDGDAGPTGPVGHTPLPEADTVPALIAGAREAGVDVVARTRLGELPAPLGRGVYRIVQEALTNAAKHAPGSPVQVDVASNRDAVVVSVANRLPATAPARGSGRGLDSIRDRATLLGGAVSTGPNGEGEFVVNAVLPLGALLPEDDAAIRCARTAGCTCLGCTIRRRELE